MIIEGGFPIAICTFSILPKKQAVYDRVRYMALKGIP
jgi:hypothetical protein